MRCLRRPCPPATPHRTRPTGASTTTRPTIRRRCRGADECRNLRNGAASPQPKRLSQNPPRTSGGGGPSRCCVLGRRNSLRLLPPPCVLPSLGPAFASRTCGVLRQPLSRPRTYGRGDRPAPPVVSKIFEP